MTEMQQSIHLELDPQNPAQFFACCGVFELASMFDNNVVADFVYDPQQPRTACFQLANSSSELSELLLAVKDAKVTAPEESGEAPVALLFSNGTTLTLDWWLEADRSGKSKFKLWAGQQTTRKSLVLPMLAALPEDADAVLLTSNKSPMSGRFGLDPRSAWNTLDFGSSVNEQGRDAYTFPAAEMLAAIGLQGFRPREERNRNTFSYRLWYKTIPLISARAVVAGAIPMSGQTFVFNVEKRSGAYSCLTFSNPI